MNDADIFFGPKKRAEKGGVPVEEKHELTAEKAISMITESELIHTFRGTGLAIVGCSHEREYIVELINKHGAELSGPMASAMNHGIVLKDEHGWLFIETKLL